MSKVSDDELRSRNHQQERGWGKEKTEVVCLLIPLICLLFAWEVNFSLAVSIGIPP
jgi:hypothetical protein